MILVSQVTSINQNAYPDALPNFRNLGTMLRILVSVNAMGLAAALLKAPTKHGFMQEFMEIAAVIQPVLLISLLLLYALYRPLALCCWNRCSTAAGTDIDDSGILVWWNQG
jgi:two-component system sensor histidine kinase AlgZ